MLSSSDVTHALNWSFVGLGFLSWIHTSILVLWTCCALVAGFSNGSFLHIVPMAYEIFVLKLISVSISPATFETKLEIRTRQQIIVFSWVILGLAIGFNLAHGIYTLVTIGSATDSLYWFLLAFSVVLFVLALLEAIIIYYLAKLKRHVDLAGKVKMK